MKEKLFDSRFILKMLIIFSIIMVVSLFTLTFTTKIIGITMLLWIIIVFWALYIITSITPSTIEKELMRVAKDEIKKRGYFKSGVYFIAYPMILIGMIVIGIDIFAMLFLFK